MNTTQDENDAEPLRRITWRTQVTITTDRGWLDQAAVTRAVAGVHHISKTLDLVIIGSLDGVFFDAAMPLGRLLTYAEQVTVAAHGRAVPEFLDALDFSHRMQQDFEKELDEAKKRREASQVGGNDPWRQTEAGQGR